MPVTDVFRIIGDNFDACFTVREADNSDDARLMDDRLCALVVRETVRDGDVAVAFGVDTRHLAAEELAVNGGIAELVDGDVIMDHLMEDGIFDEGFGEVDAGVDAEDEVFVAVPTEETLLAAGEGKFTEKAFCVGEFNGDRRKGTVEKAVIELVETELDIWNRWFQFVICNF